MDLEIPLSLFHVMVAGFVGGFLIVAVDIAFANAFPERRSVKLAEMVAAVAGLIAHPARNRADFLLFVFHNISPC